MRVCDRDCSKCVFPDCICDDMTLDEWNASEQIDCQIRRSRSDTGKLPLRKNVADILGVSRAEDPALYNAEYLKKFRSKESNRAWQRAYGLNRRHGKIKELYNLDNKAGYIRCLIDILRGMGDEEGETEYVKGYKRALDTVTAMLTSDLERMGGEGQ